VPNPPFHHSSDLLTCHTQFPTHSALQPSLYLQPILRYWASGVTTLTFQGHMMSSVTWPFDSQFAISYWWSLGLEPSVYL